MKKYQLPEFLRGVVTQLQYEKWLHRKAMVHVRRDRKRGNTSATNAEYKAAIHKAIQECKSIDAYTGEKLDWTLLSKYDNEESRSGGREYKRQFALLPSVDHVGDGTGPADFKICAWRTNDAKNDLPYDEFVTLCQKVVNVAKF